MPGRADSMPGPAGGAASPEVGRNQPAGRATPGQLGHTVAPPKPGTADVAKRSASPCPAVSEESESAPDVGATECESPFSRELAPVMSYSESLSITLCSLIEHAPCT